MNPEKKNLCSSRKDQKTSFKFQKNEGELYSKTIFFQKYTIRVIEFQTIQ